MGRRDRTDDYLLIGFRDHFRHLYSGQHEVTALHVAGVSVASAFARAALNQRTAIESRRSVFATVAIAIACLWISIAIVVPPIVARFFPAYQLFQVSRASLQPNMQLLRSSFGAKSGLVFFAPAVKGFLRR